MNDQDRSNLVRSLARLVAPATRAAAITEVASSLGVEDIVFFVSGPTLGSMLAASGFSRVPDGEQAWQSFLQEVVKQTRLTASLPFPDTGQSRTVTALAFENHGVLGFVGPTPPETALDEITLILPLLTSALACARPDADGSDLQREISARIAAERALAAAKDELSRANLELASVWDQLAAANARKDDFLAAISHELRTPLNPMLLIASEASENPKLTAAVRRDFATIAKNAEIEGRLIDDLTDITRITRGKMSLDKRAIDLRSVLQDALATVRSRLDTKKINFVLKLDARPHPLFGDSARLQQVFWNVLKSAVKFTPAGGEIPIGTEVDDPARRIVVTVSHPGSGMTPSEVARAFDSVSPPPNSGSNSPHSVVGLGVGIAISRMLVELHDGTIEVASKGTGQGATFTVSLPLASSPSAESFPTGLTVPESPPKPADPVRIRVLLVEDHQPTSVVLARLLKRRGFAVIVAASVAQAIKAAEENEFDLVVSDIGLPDGDGYSLMTTLQERHALPGIAVTGYGMQGDIERSEAAGFLAHVTKPVSVRALEAALDLVLPMAGRK
ncbi:MAG: ATP-binding protein [Opitutaceae bacterium]